MSANPISQFPLEKSTKNNIINNLHSLMAQQNITEAALARETQIPQPTLHKILAGKTQDPRISTLRALADYFAVTVDQLMSSAHMTAPQSQSRLIPVMDWRVVSEIANSKSIEQLDSVDFIVVDEDSEANYALCSRSAMEPRFPKGTIFIVSTELTPEDGDFVVVYYVSAKAASLRELSIDGPHRRLLPLNTDYQPEAVTENTRIIGVVIQSRFNYA